MAFWGIELKPGNPVIHRFENARGRLHISQACLGLFRGEDCAVRCSVEGKPPINLCILRRGNTEFCPLDLEFEEDVVFEVVGEVVNVYLSGFYRGGNCCPCSKDGRGETRINRGLVGKLRTK